MDWVDGWDNKALKDKVAILKVVSQSILEKKYIKTGNTKEKEEKHTTSPSPDLIYLITTTIFIIFI